ncbi:hypothetical protein Tco_1043613 [Tanacetum coccineum]|uniref:Retrotransposon gag domain-containing protein n=1 Tax=Tanacetum coccineum TaxID=301880 RepID=A0ABQ5GMJ5_9ASTR
MTRSTVKRLTKPLDEPEREFRRLRRAACHLQQNESLPIARRNLFDDEASSSNNTGVNPPTPPRTLHEHSHPISSGFQNPITLPVEQTGRIIDACDILLIQGTCTFQGLRNEDPLRRVKHYLSIVDNIQIDGASRDTSRLCFFHLSLKGKAVEWFDRIPPAQIMTWDQLVKLDQFAQFRFGSLTEDERWNRIEEESMQPTFRGRLKRACNQISYLLTPTREVGLKNPYLICDYCGGSYEADECKQPSLAEQVCLSGGDIYDDPSLLRFYQNDDTTLWGNTKREEKGEDGPEWIVRSKFEDELANFMLKKKSHVKGIGDMLDHHRKELHEQFSQILFTIRKSETPKPKAPIFAITTRLGVSTQDPPFPAPPRPTLKKHKKDDEDERLLSIFKQININLPFLKAMIHMPKGAKVFKDLLSHKEKPEKASSSVKLSEECYAIIQRSLPQKEGDPGSFTQSCLIGPLVVKNALADLGASINLMPHSLF